MPTNHGALAEAVEARRKGLGMSQQAASDKSKQIDEDVNLSPQRQTGLGTTSWMTIERGDEINRHDHTLHLLDQTLRWPLGSAEDILHNGGGPPEDEEPAEPCPCVRPWPGNARTESPGRPTLVDEVTGLRRAVQHLARQVEELARRVGERWG